MSRDDQVSMGSFFVQFKPARDVGPWSTEVRERPWCVAIRRPDGTAERGSFVTLELAVKRARRLNMCPRIPLPRRVGNPKGCPKA